MKDMMLKNSAGQPSASFTMMVIGFVSVTLWLLLSIVDHLGPIHIRPFDGGGAMAYCSPLMMLYFGRRWTDAKMPPVIASNDSTDNSEQPSTTTEGQ